MAYFVSDMKMFQLQSYWRVDGTWSLKHGGSCESIGMVPSSWWYLCIGVHQGLLVNNLEEAKIACENSEVAQFTTNLRKTMINWILVNVIPFLTAPLTYYTILRDDNLYR